MQIKSNLIVNLSIAFFVPLCLFVLLELLCRAFKVDLLVRRMNQDITLEMPTWLLADQGAAYRATRIVGDQKTLAWMNYFEEGSGFRVRLRPNIDAQFVNTFSQIRYYLDHPFSVRSNSLGFRGPELSLYDDPAIFRVLIFGDSSSFGWGVNQDQIFAALLYELLRQRRPERKIEVANFAIPGDSSEYGRLIFDTFASRYPADVTILGFGANDAKASYVSHYSQVEKFKKGSSLSGLRANLRKSALFRAVDSALSATLQKRAERSGRPPKKAAVPRARFRQNLRYMGEEARRLGSEKVILLGLCTPGNYLRSMQATADKHDFTFFNGQGHLRHLLPEIMAEKRHPGLVAEMKAAYPRTLQRNSLYYISSDGCHPNRLGHQLLADRLAELLIDLIDQN